jgi:hypothetical protein
VGVAHAQKQLRFWAGQIEDLALKVYEHWSHFSPIVRRVLVAF